MGQLVKNNNNDSSNNIGEAAPISITKAPAGPAGHPKAAICRDDPTLRAQPTPHRAAQAPRSGFPAPNPAKLGTCVEEEGKFGRRSSKPLCLRGGRRGGQGDGSPGSGARNSEARRDVPGPAGRRTLLKDKGALTRACRPKPPRSSSKQAAGRARPGRGPRVPRKLQAAQVEPGRRHRKSRVSSLPFLRQDLVTGKREVPQTGGRQLTSRLRHASPQALQLLRAPRGAAGGGGWGMQRPSRSGRGMGGGSGESRAGCGGQPCAAEAEQICFPRSTLPAATWGAAETSRPTALGRLAGATGDRTRRRRYRGLGLLRPRRLSLFCRTPCAFTLCCQSERTPSTPRTRVHARSACFARCVHI
ncbi:uncharacterized protein LOC112391317 [Neophocaena asiaeorientalis asiaeorientalis]|uniref:Uncharacterized protein LOC112391317 n=1 Tax=Neophocaena asiaeorientalis asiaeorientalis TaxID=1706337 RepID=A0A341ACK1_NEOAA|nr:uncharacterized protein LOC112391317 [Neophocaena asiaeorientalis asiaeorientalis]